MKNVLNIFISIIGTCWCAVIAWQGTVMASESLITNARSDSPLMWPLFPSQATIPIGAFLLCLILFIKLIKNLSALFQKRI